MKQKAGILISIIVFTICACSTPSINSNVPSEPAPDTSLFDRAENFFEVNSHENALKAYKQYLGLYPNGSKADLALMRIATIYSEQKNHDAKIMAYRRLIAEHPDSRFVADAMVEILVALYNECKWGQTLIIDQDD
jgi:TolA-binding protein